MVGSRRGSVVQPIDFDIPNDNSLFSQGDLARLRLASINAHEAASHYNSLRNVNMRPYFDDDDEIFEDDENEEEYY